MSTPQRHANSAAPARQNEPIDLAVMQIAYTQETRADQQKIPVLHIFGRDEDSTLEHVKVYGFEPYFYASADEVSVDDDGRIKSVGNATERDLKGRRVRKVTTYLPRHVGQIRDDYSVSDEDDIRFPDRFMIDKGIKAGIRVPPKRKDNGTIKVREDQIEPLPESETPRISPRTFTFDIEVDDRNGFPEDGEEKIICITSHDSELDAYVAWVYLPKVLHDVDDLEFDFETVSDEQPFMWEAKPETPGELPFDNFEPIREDDDHRFRIAAFDREDAMLNAFASHVEEIDPTILTGWNFEDFDLEYLFDRMEVVNDNSPYDLSPDRFARVGDVWRSGYSDDVKGRVVLDLLTAYKRTQFTEMESYTLDHIGEVELDVGKESYNGDIGDLWETDVHQLLKYNFRDVEICVELNREEEIFSFWDEVRRFVGCRFADAPIPGDAVDMYVLHETSDMYVLPSKGDEEGEDFEGGNVFDPSSGIIPYVVTLDLKSLYPMCMTTINASPETKVTEPDEYDGETYRAPNGVHFEKENDGVIRDIVWELLDERERKKEKRSECERGDGEWEKYDRQQGAVKVIMNSLYGTLGWDRFRLYDKDIAAAVTATARRVIRFTAEVVEERGYEIIYGDTDSVLLDLSMASADDVDIDPTEHDEIPDNIDEVREQFPEFDADEQEQTFASILKMKELEMQINEAYSRLAEDEFNASEHNLLIEAEKLFRRFFQAGKKKRYAGYIVWDEGDWVDKTDITGFEYQRSDIAAVTKEAQKKVIDYIVAGEDKKQIRKYLSNVVDDFLDGEYSVDEIGIPGGISKPFSEYATQTAHVKGAMTANAILGTNFGAGTKPKRVYVKRVEPSFFDDFEAEHTNDDGELELTPEEREGYQLFKQNANKDDSGVLCFRDGEQIDDRIEIDWEKMLEKTLEGPIGRVITALDMEWDAVKQGQQQVRIDDLI